MVIIDASVALKWVIEERDSDRAIALLEKEALASPKLLWAECANVLWVKARKGQISAADARAAFAAIDATPVSVVAGRTLAAAAHAIAFELDQSAYDSLYLAAALAERCVFVTADETFARAALAHPAYAGSVRVL